MSGTIGAVVMKTKRNFLKRLLFVDAVVVVIIAAIVIGIVLFRAHHKAVVTNPVINSPAQTAINNAEKLRNAGNNSAAEAVLKDYIKSQPAPVAKSSSSSKPSQSSTSYAQVQRELGSVYISLGDPTQATAAYTQATQVDPSSANYTDYITLGDQYAQQGNKVAAKQAYEQALDSVKAHESDIPTYTSYESYLSAQIASLTT